MVEVSLEIGLQAASFPEKERVSWPLQIPTVHRLDLSQLLDCTTSPGRGSGGEGGGGRGDLVV